MQIGLEENDIFSDIETNRCSGLQKMFSPPSSLSRNEPQAVSFDVAEFLYEENRPMCEPVKYLRYLCPVLVCEQCGRRASISYFQVKCLIVYCFLRVPYILMAVMCEHLLKNKLYKTQNFPYPWKGFLKLETVAPP